MHASLSRTQRRKQSLVTKNASLDPRFQSLVWTAEYDVKTLVWAQLFLSVFRDPEVFEYGGFRKRIRVDGPLFSIFTLIPLVRRFVDDICIVMPEYSYLTDS